MNKLIILVVALASVSAFSRIENASFQTENATGISSAKTGGGGKKLVAPVFEGAAMAPKAPILEYGEAIPSSNLQRGISSASQGGVGNGTGTGTANLNHFTGQAGATGQGSGMSLGKK